MSTAHSQVARKPADRREIAERDPLDAIAKAFWADANRPRHQEPSYMERVAIPDAKVALLAIAAWLSECLDCGEPHAYRPSGRFARSGQELLTWESPADGHAYYRRGDHTAVNAVLNRAREVAETGGDDA